MSDKASEIDDTQDNALKWSCRSCGFVSLEGNMSCPNDGNSLELAGEFKALPADSFVGTILANNYEVLELIGEGGMSVVYKARHLLLKKLVAIKMLHGHLVGHRTNLKRFTQEAQAVSALSHPNIVKVSDCGLTAEGKPYLIMDYLEGQPLSEEIKKNGCLPVERGLHIFVQTCDALAHAHSKGIVHRDLKPSNVMLVNCEGDADFVKLVDFGIAKLTQEGEDVQHLTQTGEIFGSPPYMSPEQCMGRKMDARSDIYSLGCVIYETLSGQPPHKGDNVLVTMHKHMSDIPPALSIPGCDASVAERLDAMVFKALEKDPDKRFQTMTEFKEELMRLAQAAGARGFLNRLVFRLSRGTRKTGKWISDHPLKTIVAALALCALLAAGSWSASTLSLLLVEQPAVSDGLAWEEGRVAPEPADFADQARTMTFICDRRRNITGDGSPEHIEALNKTAHLFMKYGYWGEATQVLQQVLTYTRKADGPSSISTADVSVKLADCCRRDHKFELAEALYTNALNIYAKLTGYRDDLTAVPMTHLGQTLQQERQLQPALDRYRQAIEIFRHWRQEGLLEYAQAVSGAADVLFERGEFGAACEYYQEALERWKKLPDAKLNVAICLMRLSEAYEKDGKFARAEETYLLAVEAVKSALGSESPYIRSMKLSMARALWRDHDWIQAMQMADSARHTGVIRMVEGVSSSQEKR